MDEESIKRTLVRNKAKREADPIHSIDQDKPGWSRNLSWQELLDARVVGSINVKNP